VATLVVDGGSSEGEESGIDLSGVKTLRLATGVAGGETRCSSSFIGPAGGVSSVPSYSEGLTATSLGFAMNLVAHGFTCANSRCF